MKTETASRRAKADAATLPKPRQVLTPAPRPSRAASTGRNITGGTSGQNEQPIAPGNPLQGLLSQDEISEINNRCRQLGRDVVDVIISSLKAWLKPNIAEAVEDDFSHLENDAPANKADESHFAQLAIFGKEIARAKREGFDWEVVLCSGSHYHYCFEIVEYREGNAWQTECDWIEANGNKINHDAFTAFLAAKNPGDVRMRFEYEKSFGPREIVEWMNAHGFVCPDHLLNAADQEERLAEEARDAIVLETEANFRAQAMRRIQEALAA